MKLGLKTMILLILQAKVLSSSKNLLKGKREWKNATSRRIHSQITNKLTIKEERISQQGREDLNQSLILPVNNRFKGFRVR